MTGDAVFDSKATHHEDVEKGVSRWWTSRFFATGVVMASACMPDGDMGYIGPVVGIFGEGIATDPGIKMKQQALEGKRVRVL